VVACINVGDATLAVLPTALTYLDLWHNRNVTDNGLKVCCVCVCVFCICNCNCVSKFIFVSSH
jgi:hypothetical protein